jgi:hypothetical protein
MNNRSTKVKRRALLYTFSLYFRKKLCEQHTVFSNSFCDKLNEEKLDKLNTNHLK